MTEPSVSEMPATLAPTALGRLLDLYRETARSRTALGLLVANAIPLVGVLVLGWSLWTILVIYWIENGIVGLWNVPRILLAQGQLLPGRTLGAGYRSWAVQSVPAVGRTGLAVFFIFHYGLFWLVHGVFVLILPQFMALFGDTRTAPLVPLFPGAPSSPLVPGGVSVGPFGGLDWAAAGVAAFGLFLSHGASFVLNYLGRGEFRQSWAAAQMLAPYGRVVALHLTILLGGFAIAFLGAPVAMLLVLVLLKTVLDLSIHLREHRPIAVRVQPLI